MKCRLCLAECDEQNAVPLFNNDEESNLTKLIAKYLFIEVTNLDVFSTMMCHICVQHINEFHEFFQHVEEQQKFLQNEFLERKCIVGEPISNLCTEGDNLPRDFEHNDEILLDLKDVIDENRECFERSSSIDEFGYADENFDCHFESSIESEDIPLQSLLSNIKPLTSKKEQSKDSKQTETILTKSLKQKDSMVNFPKKIVECKIESKERTFEENSVTSDILKDDTKEEVKEDNKKKKYLTPEERKFRNEVISKYVDYKCEICGGQTESFKELTTHFEKEHKCRAFITCCYTRFSRYSYLLDHIESHLNPNRFKCGLCGVVLKTKVSMHTHNKNIHSGREKLKYGCNVCKKRFQQHNDLLTHMFVHKEKRDHVCKTCKKGFNSNARLEFHIRQMHGEKNIYICETCGKDFKSNRLLKVHIQHMHEERKIYVCETCGKECISKTSFDRHVAEHQGRISDPSDKCHICGKWYTLKSLKVHLKRHELEDSKCDECGRVFRSKLVLEKHIRYAHRFKLYNCTICDKTFKFSSLLNEHIAMHTGRKDYKCQHCSREFRFRSNMYTHVKKLHFKEWQESQNIRYQCPNTANKM